MLYENGIKKYMHYWVWNNGDIHNRIWVCNTEAKNRLIKRGAIETGEEWNIHNKSKRAWYLLIKKKVKAKEQELSKTTPLSNWGCIYEAVGF